MRTLTGVAALLVLAAIPGAADACSCMSPGPPCQDSFAADAVFVGTVQTVSDPNVRIDAPFSSRAIALSVGRAFRGVAATNVEVFTGMGGGDCGYPFKVGERYLVYARRADDGRLRATICSRTRLLSEAAEDLRYLETLAASSGRGARVYGVVAHRDLNTSTGQWRDYGPVPFVSVQLRSVSGARETLTDERGRYQIADLPTGKYELHVVPPPRFSAKYLRRDVNLRDPRACVEAHFSVQYDGRVRGVVLAADGQPAADIPLQMIPRDRVAATGIVEMVRAETDAGGLFEFDEVPPGEYVMGVNLVRTMEQGVAYPRTFYPGTPNARDAVVIRVGEGDHQQLESLRLPLAMRRREITGSVLWPDGRPEGEALVSLWDGDAPWRQVVVGVKTDAAGRFTLPVFEGVSYIAVASYNAPEGSGLRPVQVRVGPFVAARQTAPLQLVLSPPPNAGR